jgi:uncharacterized protein
VYALCVRTIAISGASGFVGRALTEHLRARGDSVRPLVRGASADAGAIVWDPELGTIDAPSLEGVDAVVHLAGESIAAGRWTDAQKRRIRDSRIRGTGTLASALASLGRPPAVLVSASAVGIYGDRGNELLDESAAAGTDFLSEVALAWEAAAAPARGAGIRVAHPRLGVVLDPAGGALAKMLLPFKLGVGGKLGSGAQWMSWVALSDAVRALAFAIDTTSLSGPFNVTAPAPVTNAEFTRALAAALHRPALFGVPAFAARMAFGEMADAALLASTRAIPARLVAAGFRFEWPELGPCLARLLPR